jgi:adenylyltransferase/sulfurtransferase
VDAGVLGVVPGVIGTLQALEAVKLLSGIGDPMSRRLLVVDCAAGRFHSVKLRAK